MFCPKCGNSGQAPDSYCRQCGEWLPDLSSGHGVGRFRRSSREHKVRKMRVLQFVSIGLSLASTAMIISFLSGSLDKGLLTLAALCGFLVAVYQMITVFIGKSVLAPKSGQSESAKPQISTTQDVAYEALNPADTGTFIKPDSVVDDTTALLDPVPRSKTRSGS